MRLIKKYENRCLYDTEISENINIHDLRKYVLSSIPFKVINAKTEEDITRSLLIQIILELESMDAPLFNQASLEHIIRFYGNPLQQSMQDYLEKSLQAMSFWQEQFAGSKGNKE